MFFSYFIFSIPFWVGFCFCAFYVLFPFLYSYYKTPKGLIWVPVNNQHRLSGDNRLYLACVQEAKLNFLKHKHPCSSVLGNMAIDFTRVTSYRTAALLGFFIPDARFAFVLSFTLSVLIQYILISALVFLLFHHVWIALIISILVIFWLNILVYLNICLSGIKNTLNYIIKNILNRNGDSLFDLVNDNFRYVIMSVSGIYIWITLLIIFFSIIEFHIYIYFFIFLIYFTLLPFVYLPVSIFSFLIFICSVCIHCYSSNSYTVLIIMCLAGVLSLLILFFTGILSRIKEIRQSNNDVLNMSHIQDEINSFSLKYIIDWFKKDIFFILPLVLLILICPIVDKKFYFVPIILFLFILLKIFGLVFQKSSIIQRFIIRGGIHYLFFAIVCSILIILNHWVIDYSYINIASIFVVPFLFLIPLIGNIRMATALQKTGAFYMPKEEWELYQYIKKETKPRTTILAFSFSNLQLIPVYTHSNLYVTGAEWVESPEKELEKYIKALKFLQNNANDLLNEFKNYFSCNFFGSLKNKCDEKQLMGYHLINTLIFFPYVKNIAGITLLNESRIGWSTEFIEYLKNLIDKTDNKLSINEIDYILIDKEDFNKELQVPQAFKQIYSNVRYSFYQQEGL